MLNHNNQQSGFALLMALIVVSVVISIGLSLLDLTIKQLRLSTGAKDSESAFHAANAGVECLRYWRLAKSTEFESGVGDSVPITCFGVSSTITKTVIEAPYTYKYDVQFNWMTTPPRCSQLSFITISTEPTYLPPTGKVLSNAEIKSYIPGYPYSEDKTCVPGGKCTLASVKGYNQGCSDIGKVGIVQREVLLEL